MDSFSKICKEIKSIKIQGATNVAKAAIKAYNLKPTKKSKELLIKLRPTEPMLQNALNIIEKSSYENVLNHFDNAQEFINHYVQKLILPNTVIFTHCHSNTLAQALISAHKSCKNFSIIKKIRIPAITSRLARVAFEDSSKASGIRWMKALPKSAPIARLMKIKIYFRKISSFKDSVKTPIKETRLTAMTLMKAYMYVVSMCGMGESNSQPQFGKLTFYH